MVKQCGPQIALVIPDARAERTKPQVCCFHALLNLVKRKERKRIEKTRPFHVNLMRSQVLYRAAQGLKLDVTAWQSCLC